MKFCYNQLEALQPYLYNGPHVVQLSPKYNFESFRNYCYTAGMYRKDMEHVEMPGLGLGREATTPFHITFKESHLRCSSKLKQEIRCKTCQLM